MLSASIGSNDLTSKDKKLRRVAAVCMCSRSLPVSVELCLAQYQLFFGRQKRLQQQMIVIEWIHFSLLYHQQTDDEARAPSSKGPPLSRLLFSIPFIAADNAP
jgi:hypothetical protein